MIKKLVCYCFILFFSQKIYAGNVEVYSGADEDRNNRDTLKDQKEISDAYERLDLNQYYAVSADVTNIGRPPLSLFQLFPDSTYALIAFWASWCAECRKELPEIANTMAPILEHGIDLILLNSYDDIDDGLRLLSALSMSESYLADYNNSLTDRLGIQFFPAHVLLNVKTGEKIKLWQSGESLNEIKTAIVSTLNLTLVKGH